MKKSITTLLAFILIFSLSGCFFNFTSQSVEKDGFYLKVSKTLNTGAATTYVCKEYTENMEITIPDDYEGIPIKYIGASELEPFMIPLSMYMNATDPDDKYGGTFIGDLEKYELTEDYTVENKVFNLNIGKNIEAIKYVVMDNYYPHVNDDGSITFYHAVLNVNCSEENEHFYSEDGKLYDKKTDELITDFAYATP